MLPQKHAPHDYEEMKSRYSQIEIVIIVYAFLMERVAISSMLSLMSLEYLKLELPRLGRVVS